MQPPVTHLFVYGTLQPGDVRWSFLEPFVVDEGWPDTITGRLFDTGLDYPAAILDDRAEPGGTIVGRTYALLESSLTQALQVIDAEEDTVGGRYRRIVTTTGSSTTAYVYEYGDDLDLVAIPSGDWIASRRTSADTSKPSTNSTKTNKQPSAPSSKPPSSDTKPAKSPAEPMQLDQECSDSNTAIR